VLARTHPSRDEDVRQVISRAKHFLAQEFQASESADSSSSSLN
jgi:hypothetical protein